VTLGATLAGSLLATLAHPVVWLLALAGFLVRGGIVAFLVPILVLPTPVGLANLAGPTLVEFVFGGLSVGLAVLLALGVGGAVVWIVFGGLAAAAIEVECIGVVARDEDVASAAPAGLDHTGDVRHGAAPPAHAFDATRQALRILAARMAMLFPLVVIVGWASARTVAVTYRELTQPRDVTTPIVWRIVSDVPDAIAVIVIVWLLGEVIGGMAARRIVLDGASIVGALAGAVGDVVRHPLRTFVLFAVPAGAFVLVLVPTAAAVSVAWGGLRDALVERDGVAAAALLFVFVGLWAGGLALAGLVTAWRQAAWTVDAVVRARPTIAGSGVGRPGDWIAGGGSGTL
jgi:hypothetical protein